MDDVLYEEALERVNSRLPKKTWLIPHALLFGIFASVVSGIASLNSPSLMSGVVYWVIFIWCAGLLVHGVRASQHTATSKRVREGAIREELLTLRNDYDVSTDELVALHERLEQTLKSHVQPLKKTFVAVGTFSAVWHGGLLLAWLVFNMSQQVTTGTLNLLLYNLPFLITLLMTVGLAGDLLIRRLQPERAQAREARLRALYSAEKAKYKRKNDEGERLALGDDGELIEANETVEERGRRLRR